MAISASRATLVKRLLATVPFVASFLLPSLNIQWTPWLAPASAKHLTGLCQSSAVLPSVELYTTKTNTWSTVAPMHAPRERATPVLFHLTGQPLYGRVLVTGGICGLHEQTSAVLASTEIYNPARNTWKSVGNLHVAREDYMIAELPDGRVLITGGIGADGHTVKQSEIFDPKTLQWQLTGNLITAPYGVHAVVLRTGPFKGQVLIAGGHIWNGHETDQVEAYDPKTGRWHLLPAMVLAKDKSVTGSRSGAATVVLPDGTVMVLRGDDGKGPVADDEQYTPTAGTFGRWKLVAAQTKTGKAITPRESFSFVPLRDKAGSVLLAGGMSENPCGASIFDGATKTWRNTVNMQTCGLLNGAMAALPGGDALIIGGFRTFSQFPQLAQPTVISDVERYSFKYNAWSLVAPLSTPRRGAMAVTLTNGNVLVLGGDTGA